MNIVYLVYINRRNRDNFIDHHVGIIGVFTTEREAENICRQINLTTKAKIRREFAIYDPIVLDTPLISY